MNKKQRKRREKESHHHAQDTAPDSILGEQKGADINQAKQSDNSANAANRKHNPSWVARFENFATRHSSTVVAIFTIILAVIGGIQACIYTKQLDVIRKDQRPWIKVDTAAQDSMESIIQNNGINVVMTFRNLGKTPAQNVMGRMFAEKVKNGKQAKLDESGDAFMKSASGAIFPNDPDTSPTKILSFTPTELEQFRGGHLFVVFYGTFEYYDFFRTKHWTRFCQFHAPPQGATAKNCSDYNDIDTN